MWGKTGSSDELMHRMESAVRCLGRLWQAGKRGGQFPRAIGLRVDDLGLLLEAVRHGYGIGLTRQHFAEELLARGEIVELFDVRLRTPPHAYYVVYERAVRERPEVDTFISWMQNAFRNI